MFRHVVFINQNKNSTRNSLKAVLKTNLKKINVLQDKSGIYVFDLSFGIS